MLALYQEHYAWSGILPANFYFLKQKWKHQDNINNKDTETLGEKCPNTEFFYSYFSVSEWIRENTDQKKLRIWIPFTQWKDASDITNFGQVSRRVLGFLLLTLNK